MSALPKNVRAQVERANQLAKEFHASMNPDPNAPPADPNAAPPADPNAAPPAAPNKAVQPTNPSAPTPEPTPAPPNPSNVTPIPEPDWKQKYNVLQGKYNAEVPRLQNTVRDIGERLRNTEHQLTATQNLLASLGEQRATAPAAPTQATPPVRQSLIKDEEVREYGADLIDVVRRVAREEQAALLPEIDRRVTPVKQRVEQVVQATEAAGVRQAQSDRQTVLNMLNDQVPNWLDMNSDQGFLGWLDQKDPYAGKERGELLKQAFEAHDGPRVVAFFTGYLKEHAVVTPPVAPTAPAAPKAPQRQLEQLVAPGTPKTGTTGTQDGSGKRVWTRAEISAFYGGRMQFKDAAHKKEVEKDIFAAQREGRIR
jgi:hypothetical protein